MKKIIIKSIHMVNFRTFKDKAIEFDQTETSIRGMNATGKSTVMMAFNWLLFDKDQFGRTNFEIKPLTDSGEPVHQVDSEVEAVLLVGGDDLNMETVTLKKTFHEKWNKPRGKAEAVFNGHETLYYFNDVPLTMREYNNKIETICPELLFRLLTNPLYFPSLPWQEQRKLLFDIAGSIDLNEIAKKDKDWMKLLQTINAHKTLDEYKREISSEKRKINDDLDRIPARIDEVQKSMPQAEDWQNIHNVIYECRTMMEAIDKEISDVSAGMEAEFESYRKKQAEINKKKNSMQDIEYRIQQELNRVLVGMIGMDNEDKSKIKTLEYESERLQRTISNINQEREGLINEREQLRAEYRTLNSTTVMSFNDADFVCPTCKRQLDDDDIENKKQKLIADFNTAKANDLQRNITKGKELSYRIDSLETQANQSASRLGEVAREIIDLKKAINDRKEAISEAEKTQMAWKAKCEEDVEYIGLRTEIGKLTEALGEQPKRANTTEQTEKKNHLLNKISDLNRRLAAKDVIEKAELRKGELLLQQKDLSQKLADLEKVEYAILGFTKARIEAIEGKINGMFEFVRFKLFKSLVNGSEEETCQIMVDGVPWNDLNNAMRINSGVDVMRTLSNHYGIYPPVWFDNSEACNSILPMDAQTIKLFVTTDPILTVN